VGANSLLRRAVKASLYPFLNEHTYSYLQGLAKALDIRNGTSAEPELDLISYAVQPGDEAIDLGANYGFYTYPLSKAVGSTGRVYAFEPVPFTYRTLVLVSKLLGIRNATLIPKGCSDRPGTIAFTVPLQKSGAPGAGQAYIGTRNDNRAGADTQVRWERTTEVKADVVVLDDFLPQLRRVSLIKSDIEGAELLAFRGAARIIDRHKPTVICEINPWFLDGFGLTLGELVAFFTDRGYGFYRYVMSSNGAKRLTPVAALADVDEDNYVFIHPERLEPFRPLLGEPRTPNLNPN
jgi:FkbM family methyltransferase